MDLLSYFVLFHQAYNTHLRTDIDNQSSMDLLVYFLELIHPPRTYNKEYRQPVQYVLYNYARLYTTYVYGVP